MNFLIRNKEGRLLANIEIDQENNFHFLEKPDLDFSIFLKKLASEGVPWIHDTYDPGRKSHTLVEDQANTSMPFFGLALKEYLERSGYEVIEKHPETEEKIRELLVDFPDTNRDKIDILKRLPEMSYLEQTAILGGLERIQSKDS